MSDISISPPPSANNYSQLIANNAPAKTADSKLDAVSQDFEAVFISQMLGSMFSGDSQTDYFGGGSTGDIYRSLMMNEYGKAIAKTGGLGISAQVKNELLKLQEVSNEPIK
ncbi:MAG: rod-binding protein [Pseudomonadota bacterium]